jgi:hypothetical protein
MEGLELLLAVKRSLTKEASVAHRIGQAARYGLPAAAIGAGAAMGGAPGAAAVAGTGAAAKGAARASKGAVKGVGKMLARTASTPMGALSLATMPLELSEAGGWVTGGFGPAGTKASRKAQADHLASQLRHPKTKRASVKYDLDDVREALSLKNNLEKQASKLPDPKDLKSWFGMGVGLGVGSALMGVAQHGTAAAAGRVHEMGRMAGRDKQYQAMVTADPTLKNNKQAKTYFRVLHRASPYLAGEPTLAAATVRSMVETPSLSEGGVPYITPKAVKDILDVERTKQEGRRFNPMGAQLPKFTPNKGS